MKYFLCVIGMVMFIEGFPYVAFPNKFKRWIVRITEASDGALRASGLLLMGGGLALMYWAQS